VFATASSDTATVITAAFAGVATIVPKAMAATRARAIFLNEFIYSYSPYFFCVLLDHRKLM
jgi:hypothetical protein